MHGRVRLQVRGRVRLWRVAQSILSGSWHNNSHDAMKLMVLPPCLPNPLSAPSFLLLHFNHAPEQPGCTLNTTLYTPHRRSSDLLCSSDPLFQYVLLLVMLLLLPPRYFMCFFMCFITSQPCFNTSQLSSLYIPERKVMLAKPYPRHNLYFSKLIGCTSSPCCPPRRGTQSHVRRNPLAPEAPPSWYPSPGARGQSHRGGWQQGVTSVTF